MTKLGIAVVRADPELMVYTLLSGILSLLAIGVAISGSIGLDAWSRIPNVWVRIVEASWFSGTWLSGLFFT